MNIEAHGKTLVIRKAKIGRDWILKLGSRIRWGNRKEVLEDITYFQETDVSHL